MPAIPTPDLKPCPICGEPAELEPGGKAHPGKFMILCSNPSDACTWPMTKLYPSLDEAAAAWNNDNTH